MIRNITVGIDVGTYATRVAVSEHVKGEKIPRIIGTGTAQSKGLRHGYITNIEQATKSIEKAIKEAEKNSGITIKRVFVTVGGIGLESVTSVGASVISKADGEVTQLDVQKATQNAEENLEIKNRRILHRIPVGFKLDGKNVPGRPEKLKGLKLEARVLFITTFEQHLDDLLTAVSDAGVEIIDVIASPIAAGEVALSDRDRNMGSLLLDIGAETVTIAVFEEGTVVALKVFATGSTYITNDIALGMKVSLEEAEGLKTGAVLGSYSKKKLDDIIEARIKDIYWIIDSYLKKIKRSGLLPAGVIVLGGGSHTPIIESMAKEALHLPCRIGLPEAFAGAKNKIRDTSWFPVLGLTLLGKNMGFQSGGGTGEVFSRIKKSIQNLFNQLMP
jgi:cell division protein FtsA